MKSLFKSRKETKRDERVKVTAKRSIHWDLSFLVNICKWRKRRRFDQRVLFSPSEYYHCESIEDVHENDSRSCQVSFSFFVFSRKRLDVSRRRMVVGSVVNVHLKLVMVRSFVKSIPELNVSEIELWFVNMFLVWNILLIIFFRHFSIRSSWVYLLSIDIHSVTLASLWERWLHSEALDFGGLSTLFFSSLAN